MSQIELERCVCGKNTAEIFCDGPPRWAVACLSCGLRSQWFDFEHYLDENDFIDEQRISEYECEDKAVELWNALQRDLTAVAQARAVLSEYSEAIEQVRAWNRSDLAKKLEQDPLYLAVEKLAEILEVKEGE